MQLLCGSIYPTLLFNYFIKERMMSMSLDRVEKLISTQKIINAYLIVILLALGFTRYKSMDLMNSLVYGGIISYWTIIVIYSYLIYYAGVATFFLMIILFMAFTQCFSFVRRRVRGGDHDGTN